MFQRFVFTHPGDVTKNVRHGTGTLPLFVKQPRDSCSCIYHAIYFHAYRYNNGSVCKKLRFGYALMFELPFSNLEQCSTKIRNTNVNIQLCVLILQL